MLVSATPQNELEYILRALNLAECLMIGDAIADLKASSSNQVPFLLRRHKSNAQIFNSYLGPSVKDFVKL